MSIAAGIIYVLVGFFGGGPFWPVTWALGHCGCLGQIAALGWWALLLGGFA